MARGLQFRILVEERLYYPCSENKGADQLCGYREADLCLCFCICKKLVFSRRGSYFRTECSKLHQEITEQKESEMRAAMERLSSLKDSEIMATKAGWEKKVVDLMSQVTYSLF